jgi:hypothetical protein
VSRYGLLFGPPAVPSFAFRHPPLSVVAPAFDPATSSLSGHRRRPSSGRVHGLQESHVVQRSPSPVRSGRQRSSPHVAHVISINVPSACSARRSPAAASRRTRVRSSAVSSAASSASDGTGRRPQVPQSQRPVPRLGHSGCQTQAIVEHMAQELAGSGVQPPASRNAITSALFPRISRAKGASRVEPPYYKLVAFARHRQTRRFRASEERHHSRHSPCSSGFSVAPMPADPDSSAVAPLPVVVAGEKGVSIPRDDGPDLQTSSSAGGQVCGSGGSRRGVCAPSLTPRSSLARGRRGRSAGIGSPTVNRAGRRGRSSWLMT